MTAAALRKLCLRFPGAEETFPFSPGVSVFKVGGKMFALTALEERPLRLSLKCEPELAVELRNTYSAIGPGYHLPKRHWNTLRMFEKSSVHILRRLSPDKVRAYELVDKLPASSGSRVITTHTDASFP